MRVILFGDTPPFRCANFDNDNDAQAFLDSNTPTRELSQQEVIELFGSFANFAGDKYTTVTGKSLQTATVTRIITQEMINELLRKKLQLAQVEKVRVKDGGFIVDGVLFDSDQGAKIAYLAFQKQLESNPSYAKQWQASKDFEVFLDAELFAKVMEAALVHEEACFNWYFAKKAELEAAANVGVEAIEQVTIEYGS